MKKNKFNLRTFNLQTHFKEHIMIVSCGSPAEKTSIFAVVLNDLTHEGENTGSGCLRTGCRKNMLV
jgi:hypothetical protein